MDQAAYLGILRHLLSIGGGVLVTQGIVSDGQLQTIVGAVIAIAPIVWSVIQKRQQKAAVITAAASGLPVQATVASPVKADPAAVKGLTP